MRVIVVSNRVPKLDGGAVAGGLAVGLKAALEGRGGIWFGWSGRIAEDAHERDCRIECTTPFTLATTELTDKEHARYYQGFCNRALWPLLHGLARLVRFDPLELATYRRVNARFARHVARLARGQDLVWVHDYHLMLLGRDLRNAGVEAPLGFFLHTPFPRPDLFLRLPCHGELADALTKFDLLGFQTPDDAQNFREYALQYLGAVAVDDGSILLDGRRVRMGAFPIGIDPAEFERLAISPRVRRLESDLAPCFAGKCGIVGADRLDYTKGIPERLRGFERLLETTPGLRRRTFLVQIAAPSREDVPEYAQLKRALERQAGHTNASHGDVDWTPVRFLNRTFDHAGLAALYRLSRVGLITPLRDGMNLVAKEYVAAQDPSDPGVLVLSRFAGAATQMQEALLVDPRNADAVAQALKRALGMPLDERTVRWNALMAGLRRDDIHRWADRFLEVLGSIKRRARREANVLERADDRAFKTELLDALRPLRAFARTFQRDPGRADDLVQQTLLKAWEHRDSFTLGTNIRSWLFTILRNTFFTEARRRWREVEDPDGLAAELVLQPEPKEPGMALRELSAALGRFPVEQREALMLVGASGFSQDEAAEICGCRPGTIKSRVYRGREALAQMLGLNRPELHTARRGPVRRKRSDGLRPDFHP